MRRVPQEGVFAHRTHIPYHRRPSPVPNVTNAKNARERDLFPYSTTGKSTQIPEKEAFSQAALPTNSSQTPDRGLFPDGTTGKCPSGNPSQLRYCGSRELYIPAAVFARMDLFRRRCTRAWI